MQVTRQISPNKHIEPENVFFPVPQGEPPRLLTTSRNTAFTGIYRNNSMAPSSKYLSLSVWNIVMVMGIAQISAGFQSNNVGSQVVNSSECFHLYFLQFPFPVEIYSFVWLKIFRISHFIYTRMAKALSR